MTTLAQAIAAVEARLNEAPFLDVFVGEPVARLDSDGLAHPYAAIYPGPGRNDETNESLCDDPGPRVWRFQVTAAGGDITRATRAVTSVLAQLVGWQLAADTGVVRQDADPGPLIHDTSLTPSRWYSPLLFVVVHL